MNKNSILEINVHASLRRIKKGNEFFTRYKFNEDMINRCLRIYGENFEDNNDFLYCLTNYYSDNEVFYLSYQHYKRNNKEGLNICHNANLRKIIRSVMKNRKENNDDDEFEFIEQQIHMHGDNLIMHELFNCDGKEYVMQIEPCLILTKGFKDYDDISLLPFLYKYSDNSELNNIFENHKVTVIYKYIFNGYNEKKRYDNDTTKDIQLRKKIMKNKLKKEESKPHISLLSPLLSDENLIELFKDDNISKQPKRKKEKKKSPINDILTEILSEDSQSISDIDIAEKNINQEDMANINQDVLNYEDDTTKPDISINQETINYEDGTTKQDILNKEETINNPNEQEALKESELTIEYKDSIDPNDKPKINHYLHTLYNENQNFKNRMKEYDIIFITKSIHYDLLRSKKSCHFNAKLINKTNAIMTNEYHFYIHPFNDKIYSITEINNIF